MASPAFAHGHRGVSGEGWRSAPRGRHSELWSYDVEVDRGASTQPKGCPSTPERTLGEDQGAQGGALHWLPMLPVLGAVLGGLLISQVALLVTTVYLHRCLAHRALRLSPGVRAACRVLIWAGTGTRPRQWVAVHRKHHAFTDTERDPHSPIILGYARVQFANALSVPQGGPESGDGGPIFPRPSD